MTNLRSSSITKVHILEQASIHKVQKVTTIHWDQQRVIHKRKFYRPLKEGHSGAGREAEPPDVFGVWLRG